MSRNFAVLMAVVVANVAISTMPLYGQVGGVPGSKVSPWLNLEQKNGGPLDNYHMFVQPAQQLHNTLNYQQMGIQHNANGLNTVADQYSSATEAYFSPATPTGIGAGFMNYGRYFNNTGSGAPGSGVFGMPGTGGFSRPGGVGAFGTPGLGGANAGGGGYYNAGGASRGMSGAGGMGAGY